MRRIATARSLGLVLGCATAVGAQEAAPPPAAAPPAVEAPAPAELPPGLEAGPLPDDGPVLAVPGLAIPGGGPSRAPRPTTAPASGDLPALVGPAEEIGSGSGTPPWMNGRGAGEFGRGRRPLTLESVPEGSLDPLPDRATDLDARRRREFSTSPQPPSTSAPRRRLFGRLQPPPLFRGRTTTRPEDSIDIEPRSDPAADAALKRRLEDQIRDAAGSRLRTFEVRVVDRDITVNARVSRFWYRRAVKRTIETLPGLTGYRTHIDVVD
jgi:hypothetical protein